MFNTWLIVIAFVVVMALLITNRAPEGEFQAGTITAQVSRVVDGDTVYLRGRDRRVRIWGINAPELAQEGGQRSAGYLHRLIGSQALTCQIRGQDRYERDVAMCFLPDGRDVGAEMIRAGHAVELPQYSRGHYRNL